MLKNVPLFSPSAAPPNTRPVDEGIMMRLALIALTLPLLTAPLHAEPAPPAHVTAIIKDARHSGTLSITEIQVDAGKRPTKLAISDIASIQFGDFDVIRTWQGRR